LVTDNDVNVEIAGYAALSLGLIFCGSAEEQCVGVALQVEHAVTVDLAFALHLKFRDFERSCS
jgi:hypothetical protein